MALQFKDEKALHAWLSQHKVVEPSVQVTSHGETKNDDADMQELLYDVLLELKRQRTSKPGQGFINGAKWCIKMLVS